MAVGPQETVLFPLGSRVLAVVLVAVCLVIEASLIIYGHLDVTLRATPVVALVAVGALVLFWYPRVELTPAELVVVNPLRTHRITWPAIEDIDTQWSMAIVTAHGRVTAWAAPAPGLFSQLGRMRRTAFAVALSSRREVRGAEQARSVVLSQWEAYREQGVLGAVEGRGQTVRWNVPVAAVLVVLVILTVAGASWP